MRCMRLRRIILMMHDENYAFHKKQKNTKKSLFPDPKDLICDLI